MAVQAYPATTSVAQGEVLDLHLAEDAGTGTDATVVVTEVTSGTEMTRAQLHVDPHPSPADPAAACGWPVGFRLPVPASWPSGLYAARLAPGRPGRDRALFVVRPARPGVDAPILVSVPFPTFHAYAWAGRPGASPYWNEQPDRARRVSLHRPIDAGPGWETPILRWLAGSGVAVEHCSGFDLHERPALLAAYRLLVCVGHDEYWSAGMRDAVEGFLAAGGNVAFLTGNTCWWQFRLEDGGRTFVCYRDATEDPLTGTDDARVTVEWSSAPVGRPENSLTGAGFRRGAGCWANTAVMAEAAWTATFADHWVFDGTGLADGGTFGAGTVGYETDAAEVVEDGGVVRATGRDGTPPSFVVLAHADLSSWRRWGQGGAATMGVFRAAGGGTVFTAATTGWSNGLAPAPDPVVERITRNVLTRLARPRSAADWEPAGPAEAVTALTACENLLFAADAAGRLRAREPVGQNLAWLPAGRAEGVRALAAPREAVAGCPVGLYAVTADGRLWQREPVPGDVAWAAVGAAPGVVALAASYEGLFGATAGGDLLHLRFADLHSADLHSAKPGAGVAWARVGHAAGLVAMTNLNGRLFGVTRDGALCTRPPVLHEAGWTRLGPVPAAVTGLAGHAGRLWISTVDDRLWWRDAVPGAGRP